jgi:hypothetical protein
VSVKVLFTAKARATGGRNGHTEADDRSVAADLSVPKAMGGPGKPNTTTPEHLFASPSSIRRTRRRRWSRAKSASARVMAAGSG